MHHPDLSRRRLSGALLSLAGAAALGPPAWAGTLEFAASTAPATPLTIYGVLDPPQARPLLQAFTRQHPEIELVYQHMDTLALHRRVLAEQDAPRADVIMSPAMPWQYQLANAGLSSPIDSPVTAAWPRWARWRHELFGFTFEPIVMVYRRDLVAHMSAPESHAELLARLDTHSELLKGRVVTYDPRLSGAGYTYAIEDARISARYWDLVAALGRSHAALEATTSAMLAGLSAGRYWIGYNLIGSYAQAYVANHPELEMVIPRDYALVLQRLVMRQRGAPHPEAAERFIDFLLGRSAQTLLATRTTLGAVDPGVSGPGTAGALRERLGDAIRPVQIGPGLLATLDTLKRQTLLEQWQQAFANRTTFADGPLADPAPLPATTKESPSP
ncbi:extracellular solute-binding protein [Salinicola sp. JS01]|uniref:ABC transporter substrate-binding protein n=1 Tax=Salinicola sp. JS01 TaxID=3050071 RepID=UPI00255B7965|nr:extracellular solute-binding protein [Salinicola sp. JS01]WIX34306.1 extracellular solute-binding protein [Salinicola sp. JS01]